MKLSEVPIGKNARIICDAEFEDMNYCTSKVTEPFLSFMEKEKLNKAVLRSIDILDYLSHSKKPVTLSAISKDLGIPKSSVFDIIHTLVPDLFKSEC